MCKYAYCYVISLSFTLIVTFSPIAHDWFKQTQVQVQMMEYIPSKISSSEYKPIGSILLRTVPWKRIGSWGMIPNQDLRSWRPSMQTSIPSIIIFPPEGSTSLKNTWIRVDFPLPVRPTTPIFSPPWMLRVMPLRTRGELGRYLTCSPSLQTTFESKKDYEETNKKRSFYYITWKFFIKFSLLFWVMNSIKLYFVIGWY